MRLTYWSWVTHICFGNLTIIGSDNGLSPSRCQAIIWTNPGILFIGPKGTTFWWNLKWNSYIFIQENVFECVVSEMAAILFRPQCVKEDMYITEHPVKMKILPNWPFDNCYQINCTVHKFNNVYCALPSKSGSSVVQTVTKCNLHLE